MTTRTLDEAVLAEITADTAGGDTTTDHRRPLTFVDATIHTLDPVIGDFATADLLLGGDVIVAVGPGLHTAAEDDGAIVVDCTGLTIVPAVVDSPYLGMWIDETGFIHQELTADGRYDETRGGRPHAYQGSFWIHGDRIVYRDDLGFWAYGRFSDDVLHHAGYAFHRR
ncbi:Atu4866 domain-containing protein [Solwaraspora sp. WMMB762]|uniref:Atu4866 domain-containing protein n=1 Tax=Solwaraspora sp. WMMB762 TaxID=3404120 RepID=UPI003B94BFF9